MLKAALTVLPLLFAFSIQTQAAENQNTIVLENDYVKYVIAANGKNLHFIDKLSNTDLLRHESGSTIASIKIGSQRHIASSVSRMGDKIIIKFGNTDAEAVIKVTTHKQYLVFQVQSLTGKNVESFAFIHIPLTLKATPEESFAAVVLATNIKADVRPWPQPVDFLVASCWAKTGFAGAEAAVVGCPQEKLRKVLQEVVNKAEGLPKSDIGGPWALDADINKGSYLFNFTGMTEENVDDWIKLAKDLGINQIDFHGGRSFRFGDCRPDPKIFPQGYASFKAVIDRLHAAGIKAGLHTYAFFIAKDCPWVTPVPDRRLASDAVFTLSEPLTANVTDIPVVETTEKMSTITGFFVRNSVTLRIDDELITYSGISKEKPYAFTGCKRGACGTAVAEHKAGAKVHHLKECFGLFVPDGDSTLLEEVAAKTAEAYNECGFDMIYMDALDGSDILGGFPYVWHYSPKYVYEVCKRLNKPAVMEMSTFSHHLWAVRTRMGAWDHPNRSHKRFIDLHCKENKKLDRIFLPGHLGWWAVKTWHGAQVEPTFTDDIEYLCGKCLGNDVGFSVMGITPTNIKTIPAYQQLAPIMKQYEDLRHAKYFDDSIKAKLKEPGKEFKLFQDNEGKWRFRPAQYAKHKVESINPDRNKWSLDNPFKAQPVKLRIEALLSAGAYDNKENIILTDFTNSDDFADRTTANGVSINLTPTEDFVKAGKLSGKLVAASSGKCEPNASWAKVGRKYSPVMDLSKNQALGVWIHGDGQGEIVNFQLTCPSHIVAGIGEHYVVVDFKGWRYFELIEPEGERYAEYSWPYGSPYKIYREHTNYGNVENLNIWVNNLPPNKKVTCYLSPVKALPLVETKLINPAITINGKTMTFPVEMPTGSYLEFYDRDNCILYDKVGKQIAEVKLEGNIPVLKSGHNELAFTCGCPDKVNPRAKVTVISYGQAIN